MNKYTYSSPTTLSIATILFCLLNTQAYSYLDSVFLWQKNAQKVLILGDGHIPCAADARDKLLLTTLFTHCAERQNPTQVLFEHIPYTWYLLTDEDQKLFDQYTHKDYMMLMGYVSQYALWCNHHYKSLKFSKSDLRYLSEVFRCLTALRTTLDQYLQQKIKNQNTSTHSQLLTQEQKTELTSWIMSTLEQIDCCTQNDSSYQEISIVLDSLVTHCIYLQAHTHDVLFNELIARLSDKIQNFKNQLQDFSAQYTTSSVLASANAYIAASNTSHDLEKLLELYKPLIEEIADLGFIKELLDTLPQNNNIIVYTGFWHSTTINQALQASGFTCTHTLQNLPQEPTAATQQTLLNTIEEFAK